LPTLGLLVQRHGPSTFRATRLASLDDSTVLGRADETGALEIRSPALLVQRLG
jgi:hypothetical protein